MIAEDLIAKQDPAEMDLSPSDTSGSDWGASSSLRSFTMHAQAAEETMGRSFRHTIARFHYNVTILFTDIVGFTAMSQEAAPWEVRRCDFAEFSFADAIPLSLSTLQKIGDALSAQALRLL